MRKKTSRNEKKKGSKKGIGVCEILVKMKGNGWNSERGGAVNCDDDEMVEF